MTDYPIKIVGQGVKQLASSLKLINPTRVLFGSSWESSRRVAATSAAKIEFLNFLTGGADDAKTPAKNACLRSS